MTYVDAWLRGSITWHGPEVSSFPFYCHSHSPTPKDSVCAFRQDGFKHTTGVIIVSFFWLACTLTGLKRSLDCIADAGIASAITQ